MIDPDDPPRAYASPPRLAGEVASDSFDPLAVDSQQALDTARWRQAQRERLLDERRALSPAKRQAVSDALAAHLARFLQDRFDALKGRTLSAYWPIKGEPDLRPLLADWHATGAHVALPVVEVKAAPLIFRRWTPQTRMVRGDWNIPVPPLDAEPLLPEITLAPLIGWALRESEDKSQGGGWRLGYGGGYFDRTLAVLTPRPFTIGVGFRAARLATISPQPHDIALDAILTEAGVESGPP